MAEVTEEKTTINVRQDLVWHFTSWYLSFIHHCGAVADADFFALLNQLESYVGKHLDIPDGTEISESYVIMECKKY